MGGGDLNQKKSWHPHTFKNQERVWKAEQIEAAEKQKLAELQREITEERSREELRRIGQASGVLGGGGGGDDSQKLEWMYRGPKENLNREDYLLGRSVDKTFEQFAEEERTTDNQNHLGVSVPKNHVEYECVPFSIRAYKDADPTSVQVDMARKIAEDPLMMIKQREMESRKKLLENPVKLKELKQLLQSERGKKKGGGDSKKSKKEKKASKKKKRKKKRSRSESSSSSSSSGSDVDDALLAMLSKQRSVVVGDEEVEMEDLNFEEMVNLKYDTLNKELDKMIKGGDKEKKNKKGENPMASYDDRRESNYRPRENRNQRDDRGPRERDHRDDRSRRTERRDRSRSRERATDYRSRKEKDDWNRQKPQRERIRDRSRSPERKRRDDRTEVRRRSRDRRDSPGGRPSKRRSPSPERKKRRSPSPEKRKRRSTSGSPSRGRKHDDDDDRPSSSSQQSNREQKRDMDSDDEDDRRRRVAAGMKNYGLVSASGESIALKNSAKSYSDRRATTKETSKQSTEWKKPTPRAKLTDKEKEERLREMMQNAEWRNEERESYVRKYHEEGKREEDKHREHEFDKNFIHKELHKSAQNETVESRIKSNRNNIQRSSGAMDSNFARR